MLEFSRKLVQAFKLGRRDLEGQVVDRKVILANLVYANFTQKTAINNLAVLHKADAQQRQETSEGSYVETEERQSTPGAGQGAEGLQRDCPQGHCLGPLQRISLSSSICG